jgi:hypothetical protein
METDTPSEFARIYDNVRYLESHLLTYEMRHVSNTATGDGKCKYCGIQTTFISQLEKCEVATKETQENARQNIEGARLLISKISEMPQAEREKVLGFLNQCLQHHYM